MLTNARIREDLQPVEGIDWITALRAPQIQALVAAGALQLSWFDERDLAEITHPDYPGERLMACRNPLLAADRARKRDELLAATEKDLTKIQSQTQRRRKPLRGKDAIGMEWGSESRTLLSRSAPGTIDQSGPQVRIAFSGFAAKFLSRTFIVTRTNGGPGCQMFAVGIGRHIGANFRQDRLATRSAAPLPNSLLR